MEGAVTMNGPVVIEFTGLPGAGKSSIAEKAMLRLEAASFYCYRYEDIFNKANLNSKLLDLARFIYSRPALVLYLLAYTLYSTRFSYTARMYGFSRTKHFIKQAILLENSLKKMQEKSLVILDQGLVQCLWSITEKGGRANGKLLKIIFTKYSDMLPKLLVEVEVKKSVALCRIKDRSKTCIYKQGEINEVNYLMEEQLDNYKILRDALFASSQVASLKLDGCEPLNQNVEKVVSVLRSYCIA